MASSHVLSVVSVCYHVRLVRLSVTVPLGARDGSGQSSARLPCFFAPALYTLLKIELLTVPVLSENDSCSIPSERRMLRCTFDMRVSPLRQ
jgi:hypothetical protein